MVLSLCFMAKRLKIRISLQSLWLTLATAAVALEHLGGLKGGKVRATS